MEGKKTVKDGAILLTWKYVQDRRYLLPMTGKHYRRRYAMGQQTKEGWYFSKVQKARG